MTARDDMVELQLAARGIDDDRVLAAMRAVPRELFVPERLRPRAYEDRPLPIGDDQTISQPYVVALMAQLAAPGPGDVVLDVGAGSGYLAAVLARLASRVYAIELRPDLADQARRNLAAAGVDNVVVTAGDGARGWPEHAPFSAITVSAALAEVPPALLDQLADGGRLVVPIGSRHRQDLARIVRRGDDYLKTYHCPVRFVAFVDNL